MPNYGSPHLADHGMLALCGGNNGGIMINQMFSSLTEHDNNFSKNNIELYYIACCNFYQLMVDSFEQKAYKKNIQMHLQNIWSVGLLLIPLL